MVKSAQVDAFFARLESPIGVLGVFANKDGLSEIRFPNQELELPNEECMNLHLEEAIAQLKAYFSGALTQFNLSLSPRGTEFQQQVWAQLQTVPYGTTASYGEIATAIGKSTAARAVGMANSKNPLPIVVPCHRIIGRNGSLTGFAGGLDTKRWLLAREQRV